MKISNCTEDWNKMIPVTNGKHCDVCNLSVMNLNNKSLHEIEEIQESSGKLCGRISKVQLSEFQYLHPMKRFAIALFLVFGTGLFTTSYAQILSENNSHELNQERYVIKFKAESTDGKPLNNVFINFDTFGTYQEGKTDEKGNLTLSFNDTLKSMDIFVNVSYGDIYCSVKLSLESTKLNQMDKIIYNESDRTMMIGEQMFYEEFIIGDIAPVDFNSDPFEQRTEDN
ncbi:MAG: hypothetical protein H6598_00735 [Flavobacteriales bacterium]|nr:hypothetical protein [Flavobacteriales bacterium]